MKNNENFHRRIAKAAKRNPLKASCPACGSRELLTVFPDQFCHDCDWDSVFAYVESGKLNDLNQAYFEHFILPKIEGFDPERLAERAAGGVDEETKIGERK